MRRTYSIILIIVGWAIFSFSNAEADLLQPATSAIAPQTADTNPTQEFTTLYSFFSLYQPYINSILAHQPIYFLVGTNPKKSKFQFSFRYRIFSTDGPLAIEYPWLTGLQFGYTQTSFWNLKDDSRPFEDTSYKPELFHLTKNLAYRPSWMQGLFLISGILHESNGQSEPLSRSTNTIYLKPISIFYNADSRLGLSISPKIWLYLNNSATGNPDLPDYRGYFELSVKAGTADNLMASSLLRWASKGGSVQLDVTYPLRKSLFDSLNLYLHLQYFNGLAESLINYRQRTEALRIGFSFIR